MKYPEKPFETIQKLKIVDIKSNDNIRTIDEGIRNRIPRGEDDLTERERSNRAKDFLITLILWLVAYQFLLGFFIEYQPIFKDKSFLDMLNPIMMVMVGVGAICKIYNCVYPISMYGINLNNWKSNLKESMLWTLCFILGLITFKWFLVQFVPYYEGKPVFDFSIMSRFSTQKLIMVYVGYCILAPVQEFVARGVIQGSLEMFLTGKNKVVLAIVLSNLLFGSFHIHYDMKFAMLTLLVGIFWGIMYTRQKSLLGVSLSHIIIGLFTLLCMGLL